MSPNQQKPKEKRKHYKIHKDPQLKYDFYFTHEEEWLNSILDYECPECKELVIKKGIKRTCTFNLNHLEIYGNPKSLAYQKKDVIILPPIDYSKCPECNSTKIDEDPDRGEHVCRSCGLVLSGNDPDIIYDWHKYQLAVPDCYMTGKDYN